MASQSINIDITNMDEVVRGMKDCQRDLAKGARRTMLDLANRGVNTVVRSEVTKVYNIKKKDVESGARHYKQESGSISLQGVTIPLFEVTYKGKMLTPIHFAMTPKQRPAGNRRYTIKWKPLRSGGRKPLVTSGEPGFLAPSGYSSGTPAIPFQRAGKMRKPIHAVKRLSVPIMIENEKVAPKIEREIMQRMEKGMSRYCK